MLNHKGIEHESKDLTMKTKFIKRARIPYTPDISEALGYFYKKAQQEKEKLKKEILNEEKEQFTGGEIGI